MAIKSIYAQLNCTDIDRSTEWFEILFARAPDANPMDGLVEWHHGESAGFQLFANPDDAGHGTMTLIVSGLEKERERLVKAEHKPGEIEAGDIASTVQLSDPDGNTIVLAEPTT